MEPRSNLDNRKQTFELPSGIHKWASNSIVRLSTRNICTVDLDEPLFSAFGLQQDLQDGVKEQIQKQMSKLFVGLVNCSARKLEYELT
jgi:hypothetical protein